jgi:ketosteroid isomerase-like protein
MSGSRVASLVPVLAVFAVSAFAAAGAPPRGRMNADAAIRRVLAESVVAWNRGDIAGFLESYRNSPETIFVTQQGIIRGWQAIRERYLKTYATPDHGKMGVLTFSHLEIHPLGRNYALAIGQWHLARSAANGGNAGGYFTLTFEKTSAGWRIIVDHTS